MFPFLICYDTCTHLHLPVCCSVCTVPSRSCLWLQRCCRWSWVTGVSVPDAPPPQTSDARCAPDRPVPEPPWCSASAPELSSPSPADTAVPSAPPSPPEHTHTHTHLWPTAHFTELHLRRHITAESISRLGYASQTHTHQTLTLCVMQWSLVHSYHIVSTYNLYKHEKNSIAYTRLSLMGVSELIIKL